MSTRSQISNDLNESISNVIGKNVKILFKTLVRTESRGDKVDNKVLVLSSYRIFITTTKVPTRIDSGFHLLEIEALESKKPNHISITLVHEHKPLSLLIGEEGSPEGVKSVIRALVGALNDLFPNVPIDHIITKVTVPIEEHLPPRTRKYGNCGEFSNQYAAMCDLCQTPFRAEVAWDIDTIYLAHDIRLLHLKDFDHLDQRDLIPLLVTLQHNTWFEGLDASGVRVTGEAWEALARVIRCASPAPRDIRWRSAGLRTEHAQKLGQALQKARRMPLMHTIDFSQNNVEDKGAMSILSGLAANKDGLRHITLSQCGITGKTALYLATILNDNPNNLTTLTHLDLSNNNLKDDFHNLYNFLAQPNVLCHLNICNTETMLENLWGALLRGCAARLSDLLVAKNPWCTSRRPREPPPSFRQFFTACLALTKLDISHCKMPQDALKSLLLGLACNESAAGIKLNLSGTITSSQSAHVLESCIHGVRCLEALDLSETSLELELAGIVRAVGKNRSITSLCLSRLTGKRSYAPPLIQALVQVLQESDTVLIYLDLSDCKLKADLYALLNAMGGARVLQWLDIGGNLAGDAGARLLAKALQSNSTLHTLHIDRNAISLQGLSDIALALRRSVSMVRVDFPAVDAASGGRTSAERVAALWRDLHDHLQNNQRPQPRTKLRAIALQRAWAGRGTDAVLATVAHDALPPTPLPAAVERAATHLHHYLHQYLQRCLEVFAAFRGDTSNTHTIIPDLVTLQSIKDALSPSSITLQDLLNEAVDHLASTACAANEGMDSEAQNDTDMSGLISPLTHSNATPVGGRRRGEGAASRRVRPKSVAEQQGASSEMLSLPPLAGLPGDGLAELPAPHHALHHLHHLVKGRPRRVKTRAPSRPITDQPQDIGEGLEEFWRACRTPPGSEEASLSARTPHSRSLRSHSHSLHSLASGASSLGSPSPTHSPTLQQDDTMYSVTSGESTPVLLDAVSRSASSDNVCRSEGRGLLHSVTICGDTVVSPPSPILRADIHEPSRSSDNLNKVGNGCARTPGKVRPWSVAGVNANDSAVCTTGSMIRDHPLTPDEPVS